MGDSSTENNEFQFYLLLVRQYIFQLPEEDERIRAAAWMVHLRRLRNAKDLKLRNDYIKLLLFAMHSRCLIGPFSQPPQRDKGLEHFPKNYTFPDMMRHLIEESNAQSMRYGQSKHEDQLSFTSGECRVKVKAQENSEDSVSLPEVSLKQTQTYQYNCEDNIRPTECKDRLVPESTASWVSGLTSVSSSTFSPDLKMENLTKLQDENEMKHQSIIEDVAVKKEEDKQSVVDAYQEPQPLQDTGVSLHHLSEQVSLNYNLSVCGEDGNRNQNICINELPENNQTLRNSSQFTDTIKTNIQDEINVAHDIYEKRIHNDACSHFKYSDHSHYQHCHHRHHHKPPVCHSNDQKIPTLHMEVTGRKYIGQKPPQIPFNGGMTTYDKQDFCVNCQHPSFNTDFRETKRKQETSTCWLKENAYNNLGTNPLILNFQSDYDRQTTNLYNHQVQGNCRCSHMIGTISENIHSCPLEFNNGKCSAEYRSSDEIKEQDAYSGEVMQKNNLNRSSITSKPGTENGVNTTENSERHKSETHSCGNIHTLNMKHYSHEENRKAPTKEQQFPASELQLPLHTTNELSNNEVIIKQQKSAQDMLLQASSKQIAHTQTETQENTNHKQRHPWSTEDLLTDMIPRAKSSEFNVATFRASLSADLGAYSTGYAAGYSAGYAAGIAAALHSPPEQL